MMILTQYELSNLADRRGIVDESFNRVLNENRKFFSEKKKEEYDIFLSHSLLNRRLVLTLLEMFKESGYTVYIDWLEDAQLSRSNVTPNTADVLRKRMNNSRGLVYITTEESLSSKWCPWELGYFDGKSQNKRCCILPVLAQKTSVFNGQEYMGLYPYLDYGSSTKNGYQFWVNGKDGAYISLNEWLYGNEPFVRTE